MAKVKIICPNCEKKSYEVITSKEGTLENIKGAQWYPLMKSVGHNHWQEDWMLGVGVQCKCGKVFSIHGIQEGDPPIKAFQGLKDDLMLALYCEACDSAFMNPGHKCPTCGKQF